jgi:hypothetical protein
MVDFTWMRKIRVLLWCTRESYPDGSPQGLAGRSPSSMARKAKHISAHAPRSFEFLMFMPRGFFTRLPSFRDWLPICGNVPEQKTRPVAAQFPEPIPLLHATGTKGRFQ